MVRFAARALARGPRGGRLIRVRRPSRPARAPSATQAAPEPTVYDALHRLQAERDRVLKELNDAKHDALAKEEELKTRAFRGGERRLRRAAAHRPPPRPPPAPPAQ